MVGDSCQQWPCIECVIKKQEYEDSLSKLEQRFLVYKEKLILTHELIKKYNIKCKENENLWKQQKKANALLKEYNSKLVNYVNKQTPLEEDLEAVKKENAILKEKLESEASNHAATEKHNLQLSNLVQQLKDDIIKFEAKVELEKEAAVCLTNSLKEAKAEKVSVEKRRLKTLQNIVSFADFVQKEGRIFSAHKRMLARWRTELGCLVNGEGDLSEDEGIFSPEVASSCSSRDTGPGSIAELLSDDDHNSVISISLDSNTSNVKDHTAVFHADVTCKLLTSDNTRKAHQRNNKKHSSGTVVPLVLGSNNEVMIRGNGSQVHDSPESASVPGTNPAKRKASMSTSTPPSKTDAPEVPAKNRSEVDHAESGDRNMMAAPGLEEHPSKMIGVGLPSLFEPDIPLTSVRVRHKEEGGASEAKTNWGGSGLVPVDINSDCKSALAEDESVADGSLHIENIMEEMKNVPNLLSPMTPEPGAFMSHGESHSSSTGFEKAEMRDAFTSTCVEMLDAAVGVDEIAEPPCHVAVQTRGIISCSIACQTSMTSNNTCAVQTDDTVSADSVSHPDNKIINSSLPKEESTCSEGKKQTFETQLSRKVYAEIGIQTQSVAENGTVIYDSFKSPLKGTEKINFLSAVSKQNSLESKSKKQSSMIRYDYNKPEKYLKGKVKKSERVTPQLCSDKSDDNSGKVFPFTSEDSSTPASTTQFFRPADKSLSQQSMTASSGLFVLEDAPHLSSYHKEVHHHDRLMPLVPNFHHHGMDPLLFHQNILSCALAMQSMPGLSKGCCCRHDIIGVCANMNHPCVPQAGHVCHGLRNCFCLCSSCINTGHSNCRSTESEVKVQMSSTRSTSGNKSARRVWNRIIDTEDSSSSSGGDCKMPSRKMCLKNRAVNATYVTQMDSEGENTDSTRRSTDEEDSSIGARLRKKVTTKRMGQRREVARMCGRNSSLSTDEEMENKTSRLRNRNMCMTDHLQTRSYSNNKQEGSISSRLRKRRNKYDVDHKKYIKNMSKKFPLSKQKHRSKLKLKHLKDRHLDEPIEESDTPVMRIHSQVHSNQSEAVQDMQDCRVGSYNAQISTVLQSNIQQKTRAVTEENVLEQSSCKELFSTLSDIYSDAEQQSHRTAAEIQTIQPKKAHGSVLNEHKRKALVGCADQVESKCKDCPSLERRKSKRTRTDFVSKVSDDSVIDKDSEATSNILLHYVSESSPEKYITRTCDTATAISLPLTEQASSDQELKCSTANENHSLLNVRVNAHETRQGVGKTDPSRGTGPVRKLSKLAKFRRNIIKSKMPSKIASELPEKCLRIRKMLTPASKTCIAHSKSIRPGVRSPSGVGIEGNVSKSRTNVSYLSSIPQDHSSSVGNGFVNLNTCNNSVNLHLTCNSGTDQIFSSTDIVKETCSTEEIHTESNHAEIAGCSQDRIPKSDIITETASPLSKVDHASEIHSDSSLPDKILETVTVPAVPVCHKESVPEANQTAEGMGHVTLPHTCLDADYTSENVTKVRSPDMTREAVADFTDFESPATIFKMDEMKNEIFPRICQELVLCPVSPIKDPVIGELKLKSEMVESSATTSDKKQIAELPVNGSSIKSPKRLTRSSLHQKTGSEITAEKCAVNTSTDLKVFPGCVLRWVLKYYEVECKEKHPKKSKFMTDKLKTKEVMKQQEKVIFKKELQELLSSNFSSGKFQQVLQKFAGLNSETTPLVLAKIIVKFVSDDINAQPNHTKSNSAPPLTQTQQRLVTLVYTLQSQHQQYKNLLETILLGIEYRLFRLGHVPNVIRSCSLARFHAALCLIQQDRQRVQAFCYDSMYCLYYKAFPLLFTVYTTYPDALPHASVGKDSMLMMTMTNLILMQSTDKTQTEYRIEAFKKLLQTRYGYSQRVLTTEQLFQVLVDRLRSSGGHVEGLEASLILVAKRIGWDRSYKQLLCRNLVPLIDEWRAGAVNDLTIREVIIVMGYITRCFPVMEAKACVQAVLNLLGSVLLEQNVSMEVQEAAAFSLLRLSRHNFCYVSDVLAKWQPSRSNVLGTLLEEMLLFFETRNVKWWHNFLKRKRVCL